MQKFKTKVTYIFQTHLNIFYEILEVKRTKLKKKQIYSLGDDFKEQLLFSYNEQTEEGSSIRQ